VNSLAAPRGFASAHRDLLVAVLESETATTARVLAAIPASGHQYRPDPRSRSAWELAWHVAADVWFIEGVAAGRFAPDPDKRYANPCPTGSELAEWYSERMRVALTQIKAMSEAQLEVPLSIGVVETQGAPPLPAHHYLLWVHLHTVHHRGQLAAYLRPLGAAVPPIYGPSADAQT
jgi:uncharacterized damage-inducible protein DinB